jgi:DNA-binding response OmpR family regulator
MTTQPILLVEDDENDVFFFKRAMSKAGMNHPLQVARDGEEAINYLQGGGKFARRAEFPLPGLVLLDLKLPFVMGLDVLRWIRQQPHLVPIVIILSSSREEADIAEAYSLGANAYLVKPAQASELGEMVRAVSDFWLKQNMPPPCPELNQRLQPEADPSAQGRAEQEGSPLAASLIQLSMRVLRSHI